MPSSRQCRAEHHVGTAGETPISFLTKYGTLWGSVPQHTGRVYWIAPSDSYTIDGRTFSASNDNEGLHPERALRDLNRFNTLASANSGDVAMLLEGTHTVTAVQRLDKAGLTVIGIHASDNRDGGRGPLRYPAILTSTGTSTALLSIEADNIEIGYVTLRPTSGFSAVQFRNNANPDGFYLHDFYVDLHTPALSVNTYGVDFGYRADSSNASGGSIAKANNTTTLATAYLTRGTFWSDGAQGRAVNIATASVYLRDCWFHNSAGAWATPMSVATAADNCVIDSCVWTTAGTMGSCIDGTLASVADGVSIRHCTFPRTGVITSGLVIDNFGANEAQLVECYQEGSGTALTAID